MGRLQSEDGEGDKQKGTRRHSHFRLALPEQQRGQHHVCYIHLPGHRPGGHVHLPLIPGGYVHLSLMPCGHVNVPLTSGGHVHLPPIPGGYVHLPLIPAGYVHLPPIPAGHVHLPLMPGNSIKNAVIDGVVALPGCYLCMMRDTRSNRSAGALVGAGDIFLREADIIFLLHDKPCSIRSALAWSTSAQGRCDAWLYVINRQNGFLINFQSSANGTCF